MSQPFNLLATIIINPYNAGLTIDAFANIWELELFINRRDDRACLCVPHADKLSLCSQRMLAKKGVAVLTDA